MASKSTPKSHPPSTRSADLEAALSSSAMKKAWKTVRMGLRSQPMQDLHDFLDVHRTFEAFAARVRSDVLAGVYRPASPEFALLEKRDGITRRLAIPEPRDALLLQCVVEVVEPKLKAAQPSQSAYYSRSHTPLSVEVVDNTFGYPWWILWPEFQERIYKFTDDFPFVVIADIANYYDCIPLAGLRHGIAACGLFQERLLDFLFYMLEAFTWRPFYMPHSGVGLPQLNFDAPRLLAHAYLFKLDEVLANATNNNFVRWMDDIDAGVKSREAGKRLLRDSEITLNRLGLRLNAGKSRILSAEEAVQHFWLQENRALTIVENGLDNSPMTSAVRKANRRVLRRRFRAFAKRSSTGNWDKVVKRYFKLFGKLNDTFLVRRVEGLIASSPSLRGAAFRYLETLGYSVKRLCILEAFVTSGHCEDDVSLFEAVKCMVGWRVPLGEAHRQRFVELGRRLATKPGHYTSSGIVAALWLAAKYGRDSDLMETVRSSESVWTKSDWTARQVACVTPLLSDEDRSWVYHRVVQAGLLNALGVLAHCDELRRLERLDTKIEPYLLHEPKGGHAYPFYKVLIARTVLQSRLPRGIKAVLRRDLKRLIGDRHCARLLAVTRPRPAAVTVTEAV